MMKKSLVGIVVSLSLLGMGHPSFALNIILNDIVPGGSDPTAVAAFRAAADQWEGLLSDPVTVRLDFGFQALDPGVLGSARIDAGAARYTRVRGALRRDRTSPDDKTATANLPKGGKLEFRTNDPSGTVILDNGRGLDNRWLNVPRANLKALRLLGDDGLRDATIQFSPDFSFDFDPSDGITPGAFDFLGVATTEIGHALGFVSGVDAVDVFTGAGPLAAFGLVLQNSPVFSVWDLYRYSEDSLAFGRGTLDFATGGTPFFSIDGGATDLGALATGVFNGDGEQASHWKDTLGLGIMDPTVALGELLTTSGLDLQAFDVMGWDLAAFSGTSKDMSVSAEGDAFQASLAITAVPEPSSVVLFGMGLIGLTVYAWRTRAWRT